MKKFANFKMLALVSLASIVLVASVAFAQNAGTVQGDQNKARAEWRGRRDGDHRAGAFGGGMFGKLNLTDDQKARMKQIRESFGDRTKSLREQLRAKRQELRQANEGATFNEALATQKLTEAAGLQAKLMGEEFKLHQEMLSVLTPEQKTQLDQMRQQFKSQHGNFKGGHRGERRDMPQQ